MSERGEVVAMEKRGLSDDEIDYRKALARTAAGWWADRLRRDITPSLMRDAGHGSAGAAFLDLLALSTPRPVLTAEHVERFEMMLTERLTSWFLAQGCDREGKWYGASLSTDYGPEGVLREVVEKAALPSCPLPFKTGMNIGSDGIDVSAGYRAPREWLCQTKRQAISDRCLNSAAYPEGASYDSPDGRAYFGRYDAMVDAIRDLPEWPADDFDAIVARVFAYGDAAAPSLSYEGYAHAAAAWLRAAMGSSASPRVHFKQFQYEISWRDESGWQVVLAEEYPLKRKMRELFIGGFQYADNASAQRGAA